MARKYSAGPKRPIDKFNTNVILNSVASTQQEVVLHTAGMAETLSGMKITGIVDTSTSTTGISMIVLVRDGASASTIAGTNGDPAYEPEQDILWLDFSADYGGQSQGKVVDSETKAMRKLKKGDQILWITDSHGSGVTNVRANVTGWVKQ